MASPLPVRNLGRTGLALSEVGFGAGPLGGFYGPVDHDTAIATVRTAYALGIRYFDVAPLYGHGRSELLLGHALREMPRDEFVVSSKVGRYFVPPGKDAGSIRPGGLPFRPMVDYSREGTLRSLEQSFVRLGLTRLDIVLIHDVDEHAHGTSAAAEAAFAAALSGAYPALLELKRAGDIKAIGIGVNQVPWALRFIREAELDCIMIAGRYTLLNREAEPELFPECLRRGIGVLAAGAFNGGLLARGGGAEARFNYRPAPAEILERLAQLQSRAAEVGVDLKAAAIAFVLAHPVVSSLVIGAMHEAEVRENLSLLSQTRAAGFRRNEPPLAFFE
jgi:D-threo-aldose 1-dehydrogenase